MSSSSSHEGWNKAIKIMIGGFVTLHLTHLRSDVSQMGLALRGGASDFMVMVMVKKFFLRTIFLFVQPDEAHVAAWDFLEEIIVKNIS